MRKSRTSKSFSLKIRRSALPGTSNSRSATSPWQSMADAAESLINNPGYNLQHQEEVLEQDETVDEHAGRGLHYHHLPV